MAKTNLNENATSFAAANWEDATGFADEAQLEISDGTIACTEDADQSATDIDYLQITSGRTGDIGTAASPLTFEANDDAYPGNEGRVEIRGSGGNFYGATAGGGWDRCVVYASGMNTHLISGTVDLLEVSTVPLLRVETGMVVTTAHIWSGRSVIEANDTRITNLYIYGGNHTLKREADVFLYGGKLTIDVAKATPTIDVHVYNPNAELNFVRGDITDYTHAAGYAKTKGERAITIGSGVYVRGPSPFVREAYNDIDTISTVDTQLGGQTTNVGGAIPL
jgi:hypothetical protein